MLEKKKKGKSSSWIETICAKTQGVEEKHIPREYIRINERETSKKINLYRCSTDLLTSALANHVCVTFVVLYMCPFLSSSFFFFFFFLCIRKCIFQLLPRASSFTSNSYLISVLCHSCTKNCSCIRCVQPHPCRPSMRTLFHESFTSLFSVCVCREPCSPFVTLLTVITIPDVTKRPLFHSILSTA